MMTTVWRRRFFTFCSAATLLLCLTFCTLVAIGYRRVDEYTASWQTWETHDGWRGRQLSVRVVRGRWVVRWGENQTHLDHAAGEATDADVAAMRADPAARAGLTFRHDRSTRLLRVKVGDARSGRFGFIWYPDAMSSPFRSYAWTYVLAPPWASWALPIVLAVLPACWVRAALRRRRLGRVGRCPACGYDLRASPTGCPECGGGRTAA